MNCRHCSTVLDQLFLDLGTSPPSNAYVAQADLAKPELYFPLRVHVCTTCWLAQTEDYAASEMLFTDDYAYFSSTSPSWLAHSKKYCEMITQRLSLGPASFVIEIASNDGYLLKNFVKSCIPCLGIEPTASTAKAAEAIGVPTRQEFFGKKLAEQLVKEGKQADLILGNNVFAHVPDINDFTTGMKLALKQKGTITLEFPHLMQLMKFGQFDTVYHEHYSYLSLGAVMRIFEACGLRICDVEEISTHGGSLRVYGCHSDDDREAAPAVEQMLREELEFGLETTALYEDFQSRADAIKNGLLSFLLEQKAARKRVAAYGAAAKGNTLLNFAGVKLDLLPFVCDAATAKQGRYLPGTRIPILAPEALEEYDPDFILILPWNLADEIVAQFATLKDKGTKFVTAVPELRIL